MRFSLRKITVICFLVSVVLVLDVIQRIVRKDLQHSDASTVLQRNQRDVSVPKHGVVVPRGVDLEFINNSKLKNNEVNEIASDVDRNEDNRNTTLNDIFISVKTTKKFHESRIALQLETWFDLAKQQTYFFTDGEDPEFQERTGGHLINTNCSSTHHRAALCCKMSSEYDRYIESNKRWFCHVDDDTYVNVIALERLLQKYDHKEDWYLGKSSISHPLEIHDPEKPGSRISFWFATGGAGFCLSQGLALKMMPYVGGGRLQNMCQKIRLPDDCTIGYISQLLKVELTKIVTFHSHLEGLWQITQNKIVDHITFSYVEYDGKNGWNRVPLMNQYSEVEDPTRFRSIHCVLHPHLKNCVKRP